MLRSRPGCLAPSSSNTLETLIAFVQEWHDGRISSPELNQHDFFPEYPSKKREIKLVSSGIVFGDGSSGQEKLGVVIGCNYELSAAAGARCSEQMALGLLAHYEIPLREARYLINAAHTIRRVDSDEPDECVPIALTPCPICRDIFRGAMKRASSLRDVEVITLPREANAPRLTLGSLVLGDSGSVKRGAAGTSVCDDALRAYDTVALTRFVRLHHFRFSRLSQQPPRGGFHSQP